MMGGDEADRRTLESRLPSLRFTWLELEHGVVVADLTGIPQSGSPIASPVDMAQFVAPIAGSVDMAQHPIADPVDMAQFVAPIAGSMGTSQSDSPIAGSVDALRPDLDIRCGTLDRVQADAALIAGANKAVGLTTADCLPIVVAVPSMRAAVLIHAGWRGMAANLIEIACEQLADYCASRANPRDHGHAIPSVAAGEKTLPEDAIAWIGPCIGGSDYEVGAEVKDALLRTPQVTEECFVPSGAADEEAHCQKTQEIQETDAIASALAPADKFWADLKAIAVAKLQGKGILPDRLEVFTGSTFRDQRLHSVRRDGSDAGRMATVIVLKTVNFDCEENHGKTDL
jgi:copper oxidase (laccase) domain-containing protein